MAAALLAHQSFERNRKLRNHMPQAGVTQAPPKRTETNFETPGSCMVTP